MTQDLNRWREMPSGGGACKGIAQFRAVASEGIWVRQTAKGDGNLECREKWFKLHLEALGILNI